MNISNIKKLLKAYFYENWKKDVFFNFLLIAAVTMSSMIMPFEDLVTVGVVVMIIYYPCRIFSKLHRPSSRMHYLMIPASNSEKVVTGILLANVYYVLGMYLSVIVGILLGYGVKYGFLSMLYSETSDLMMPITAYMKSMIPHGAQGILALLAAISVMFFAAIYFKRSPFWKLILTALIIFIVFGVLLFFTEWVNFISVVPEELRYGNFYKSEHYVTTSQDWFPYVVSCATIVYFYAMSFLRMRETEA